MKRLGIIGKGLAGAAICLALFYLPSAAQNEIHLTDPEIASAAVTANKIDVDYGKIALKRAKSADVRKFAQTMVNDHTAIIKQATDLAKKLGVTPKDNPLTQQLLTGEKKETEVLKSKKGKDFDKAYIDNEVAYHEAVINAVKNVLIPQTKNEQLKALLVKVSPLLQEHLEHAKMVQSKLK